MSKSIIDTKRPYLIIPKLIIQPTWGGNYIVKNKGWSKRPSHDVKIGQSYELFSGSNLSLLKSTENPNFKGEITNNDAVQIQTKPANSIKLSELVELNPTAVLGKEVVAQRGKEIALLIKFTQALGNSFQVHIRDGLKHLKYKPKPESWYYFEPGLLTFGVKDGINWAEYEECVRKVHAEMTKLSTQIKSGILEPSEIKPNVKEILESNDPWQYVNTVAVKKDQIVDLSQGGIHHSWEEDSEIAPLGNVLLELQGEAMDDISTFRSFDKGKITNDGVIRDVHIDTYFEVIDRDPKTNDPDTHINESILLTMDDNHRLDKLMRSRHYNMDKLTLLNQNSRYEEEISRYKHLFVKNGKVRISAVETELTITSGHSCFVPASVGQYKIENLSGQSEVLISC